MHRQAAGSGRVYTYFIIPMLTLLIDGLGHPMNLVLGSECCRCSKIAILVFEHLLHAHPGLMMTQWPLPVHHVVNTIMRMRAFRRKMADCTHGRTTEGVLDLCNGAVSEKTPQFVLPSLPAEYVTAVLGRTDAP